MRNGVTGDRISSTLVTREAWKYSSTNRVYQTEDYSVDDSQDLRKGPVLLTVVGILLTVQ